MPCMGSLKAEDYHLDDVEEFLETRNLEHLRARRHGHAIVLESGPKGDSHLHARLHRITANRWQLDIADHRGRWEPTPYNDSIEPLLILLETQFPWTLAPVD